MPVQPACSQMYEPESFFIGDTASSETRLDVVATLTRIRTSRQIKNYFAAWMNKRANPLLLAAAYRLLLPAVTPRMPRWMQLILKLAHLSRATLEQQILPMAGSRTSRWSSGLTYQSLKEARLVYTRLTEALDQPFHMGWTPARIPRAP